VENKDSLSRREATEASDSVFVGLRCEKTDGRLLSAQGNGGDVQMRHDCDLCCVRMSDTLPFSEVQVHLSKQADRAERQHTASWSAAMGDRRPSC